MTKFSEVPAPGITIRESANDGSDFTNPVADYRRLFLGEDGLLHVKDTAGTVTLPYTAGIADHGGFTYLDATEGAAPGTPSASTVRIYAKADGRIYSKDDGGVEYGPFDAAGGGGADLADFRLAGVKDAPGDIPLGTYGNEFEYSTAADLATAGWTATGSLTDFSVCGSSVRFCSGNTAGRGFYLDAGGNLPDNFEVAVLLSGVGDNNNMTGLGVLDSSGNGIGGSPYSSGSFTWNVTAYGYASTADTGAALTVAQSHAPHWLALRRSSATTWRFRWSADGTTWTSLVAAGTKTVTNARRIYVGAFWTAGTDTQNVSIHRVVYGTADLGL